MHGQLNLRQDLAAFAESRSGSETVDVDEFLDEHPHHDLFEIQSYLQAECGLAPLDGAARVFDRYDVLGATRAGAADADRPTAGAGLLLVVGDVRLVRFTCSGCDREIWRPEEGPFRCGHCGGENETPRTEPTVTWDEKAQRWVQQ